MAADQVTIALTFCLHMFLDLVGEGFYVLRIVEHWNTYYRLM